MVQYPAIKTKAPTFISKEGVGKSWLIKLFRVMFGNAMVFETMQQVPLQMIILVHEERFYRENEYIETQLRNFQPFGHESFPAALARLNVVIGETGDQDEDFHKRVMHI